MVAFNYVRSLANSLVYEGGYSNHPADPGGATMRGVTQRVYDDYRKRKGLKPRSVKLIEEKELQEIYRIQYATPVRFDDLPKGIDQLQLDGGINSGTTQAGKWLQRALRAQGLYDAKLAIDGKMGVATLEGLKQADLPRLARAICDYRLNMLKNLNTWKSFKNGWTARVNGMEKLALKMIAEEANVKTRTADLAEADHVEGCSARGKVEDAAMPKAPISTPAAGAGAGSVSVVLKETQDQLISLQGTAPWIDQTLGVLVVAGGLIAAGTVAYGAWAWYRQRKVSKALDLETAAA